MRTPLLFLCLVLLFTSCSSDDGRDPNILESADRAKVVSIDYEQNTNPVQTWSENYSYSNDGTLAKIEDFRSSGRRYEMRYDNDRLQEYTTYTINDEELIFRDSIAYNQNGTINAVYNFSINGGEDLPLTMIYEYEYTDQNMVSERNTYNVTRGEYFRIEKYYWRNGNVERIETFNSENVLRQEFFYTYDTKINYKKDVPIYISDPANWSANNITKSAYTDYTGLLDTACNPCASEYIYNVKGYPVLIRYSWGIQMNLTYE